MHIQNVSYNYSPVELITMSHLLRPSTTEFQNGRHHFFLDYLSGPFYQNYVLVAIHGHLNPETTTVTGLDSVSE